MHSQILWCHQCGSAPMLARLSSMSTPCCSCAAKYSDAVNMELLQLATLLMRNLPSIMAIHRKELIKFGWNHLKREDSSNKYHAFLNVCYFLEAYQAPEKIVLQVSKSQTQFCAVHATQAGCLCQISKASACGMTTKWHG